MLGKRALATSENLDRRVDHPWWMTIKVRRCMLVVACASQDVMARLSLTHRPRADCEDCEQSQRTVISEQGSYSQNPYVRQLISLRRSTVDFTGGMIQIAPATVAVQMWLDIPASLGSSPSTGKSPYQFLGAFPAERKPIITRWIFGTEIHKL